MVFPLDTGKKLLQVKSTIHDLKTEAALDM